MKSIYIVIAACALVLIGLHFLLDKPVDTKNDSAKKQVTQTTKNMETTKLIIEDEKVGTGTEAKAGDSVTVQYVGTLTNGMVFDASRNHGEQGFTFMLGRGEVIKGWDQGVAGMKVGGKRKLTIPSDLAYGNRAVGDVIPANATLVFEVELIGTDIRH